MLFQEVFSGVTSPITRKLGNKLRRQRRAVRQRQAAGGAPALEGLEDLCPGSGCRASAVQTKPDVKYSSESWQWHAKTWSAVLWRTYFRGFYASPEKRDRSLNCSAAHLHLKSSPSSADAESCFFLCNTKWHRYEAQNPRSCCPEGFSGDEIRCY